MNCTLSFCQNLARMDRAAYRCSPSSPDSSSVVVHNLHIVRSAVSPEEADSPLAVDPDAVLTGPDA